MKKVLLIVIGLVLSLVMIVLIVPGMINWNGYKGEISALIKSATGRKLVINGNIRITVLPSPALLVNDVRLSNIDGAATHDMVRLDTLEIHLALAPLLAGNIRVETIDLVRPVIELEVLEDGRKNWDFSSRGKPAPVVTIGKKARPPASGGSSSADGKSPTSTLGIRLDSFVIRNGTLVYRDVKGGIMERVNNINARIAAASLSGPFDSSGRVNIRGFPLEYDASIGKIIHGRTVPLSLNLKTASGTVNATISGVLVGMDKVPKFKGKVEGDGKSLSQLVRMVTGGGSLPGFLASNIRLKSEVVASSSFARFSNLSLNFGDAEAVGSLDLKLGKTIDATARLAVSHIDLDKWLSLPDDKPKPALERIMKEATYTKDSEGKPKVTIGIGPPVGRNNVPGRPGSVVIPANIKASLSLSVDAVTFRKGLVHNVLANAELSGGEITISQLSAQLPGDSDVAVFGFITVNEGPPVFEGELETSVGDLRGVMEWLRVGTLDVPSDRLRKMTLSSKFSVTKKQVKISDLDLNFDSSRLTGGATVALRNPLAVGANLTLDRINLDAYLPTAKSSRKVVPAAIGGDSRSGASRGGAIKSGGKPHRTGKARLGISVLKVMKSISANVIAHIKTLVYRRTSIKNIILSGVLNDGRLKLRRASVSGLVGTSANISGEIDGLGGIPEIKDVKIHARIGNLSRLARLAGVKTSLSGKKLGTILLGGRINGPLFRPSIDMTLKVAGGDASMSGTVSFIPLMSGFKGRLAVRHKDVAGLLRALNINYRPAGKIGGLDISGSFKGDGSHMDISGIVGRVGKINVSGAVGVNIKGSRPVITADIKTGAIAIDDFLQLRRTATLSQHYGARLTPAAWVVPPTLPRSLPIRDVAVRKGHWSSNIIDLSAIRKFDAAIKFKSTALSYRNYRLDAADLVATLKKGELRISHLTGNLFGGAVKGEGSLKAWSNPRVEAAITIGGMDVGRILKAVSGNDHASGKVGMDIKLATKGESVADMVSNLGGSGSIALRRLDVRGGGKGNVLSGALGLIAGLNKFGGALSGRKKGTGLADISGIFKIADGVVRSNDLKLVSSVGSGQAKGFIDLPKWKIDISGNVNLSRSVLGSIISGVTGAAVPQVVPFYVRGRLDSPRVKLDTAKVSIGGAGKRGLGGVLNRLIPSITGRSGQPTPPTSAPPAGRRKKINPRSILKGLLNRL